MSQTPDRDRPPFAVAVIGAGPAGLMAAQRLSAAGLAVTVHERMPTPGRKLLMAGRGGLNLTHSEPFDRFLTRYGQAAPRLAPILEAFPPQALVAWAEDLGQETFVGSSGRIFPKALKASPLLRAWLARLAAQGARLRTRCEWRGWDEDGALVFQTGEGATETSRPNATILALGGASWPGLGSNGAWRDILMARGIGVAPFGPANAGVSIGWSDAFAARFAGVPLKNIALTRGEVTVRGEAMITATGLEGGAIYTLFPQVRAALEAKGPVTLQLDLRPDLRLDQAAARLERAPRGQSSANRLRKALGLSPAAVNLLREAHGRALPAHAATLALAIKALPLRVTGTQSLERAISTAGGVDLAGLDEDLMFRTRPGVYAAGEMLDWEAPTGGYLLQATLATGAAVADAILRRAAS